MNEENENNFSNIKVEDLGTCSLSIALNTLCKISKKGVNCRLRFFNKKTDQVHYLCHMIEIEEIKVDENGVKWKKIS